MTDAVPRVHAVWMPAAVRTRSLRQLAWAGVGIIGLALFPLTVWVHVLSGAPLWSEEGIPPQIALAACFAAAGLLIVVKQPGNRVGQLACLIGCSELAAEFAAVYASFGLVDRADPLFGAALASWLSVFAWTPGFVALTVWLPLLFPDGRPPSPRWRPLAWAGWVPIALVFAAAVVVWRYRGLPLVLGPAPEDPFPRIGDVFWEGGQRAIEVLPWPALASLIIRYRRADEHERIQLRWFLVAAATIALLVVGQITTLPGPAERFTSLPWVPAAIAFAIFRHRLYGIEVVIRRSLVYGGLVLGVVALYMIVVGVAASALGVSGLGPSLVATALVAFAFQPAREFLEHGVERLVFGGRRDPRLALSAFGDHLRSASGLEDALPGICAAVMDATRLPGIKIELPDGEVVAAGTVATNGVRVPLVVGDHPVGVLIAAMGPGDRAMGRTESRVLTQLLPLVATAVHAVTLSREVRRSRERLIAAREEERRRLRRDLHDGLGPSLAGITMEIQAARNLLEVDRRTAADMLDAAEGWARDAISEVRRVVYGLRPPVLDQLGLGRALEEHAATINASSDGAPITIEVAVAGELDRVPAAVEVAAYLIALEGVTNVLRHAAARRCEIRIQAAGQLRVEVVDDGAGVPERHAVGVGLTSMRERAEELGGSLTVAAARPRGTRVVAEIPLEAP